MIKRIVLTGGPCSGKTTVLNSIKDSFINDGYTVIVVPETATELINEGIKCFGDNRLVDPMNYQELVLRLQMAKESVVDNVINMNEDEDIIILYDRGLLDGRAYVSDQEFNAVLRRIDPRLTYNDLLRRYDSVIVLIGAKSFYTLETNTARKESAQEALELGNKTLKSWVEHSNVKLVYPKEKIEEKIAEVVDEIYKVVDGYDNNYVYNVNLSKFNLNDFQILQSIEKPNNYIERRVYFITDDCICSLDKYRNCDIGKLHLRSSIEDFPSLESLNVMEELNGSKLVLRRGV